MGSKGRRAHGRCPHCHLGHQCPHRVGWQPLPTQDLVQIRAGMMGLTATSHSPRCIYAPAGVQNLRLQKGQRCSLPISPVPS